jgi:hypothetical protein
MYAFFRLEKKVCGIKALLFAEEQRYLEDGDSKFLRIYSN